MKDDVDSVEDPAQVFFNQVKVAKREASRRARTYEVLLFERSRVVVPEAVDADDVVAVGKQAVAKMRPDESRRSGDRRANCLTCLDSCLLRAGESGRLVTDHAGRASRLDGHLNGGLPLPARAC